METQSVRNFTLEALSNKLQRTFDNSDYFKGKHIFWWTEYVYLIVMRWFQYDPPQTEFSPFIIKYFVSNDYYKK